MREDLSEVFRELSNEAHELAEKICERAKPVFPSIDYYMMRTGDIQNTITWYFGTRDEVCGNCISLFHLLNEIVELKEACLESQTDYCLFIKNMLDRGRLSADRYRIRYDDFEPVHNNDYEKITTDMNELFKLNIDDSEETRKRYVALYDNLIYLRYKNLDDLLARYLECIGWNVNRCSDKEVAENIIESNYIIYSTWLKDYQGDKELHNQFVKCETKVF